MECDSFSHHVGELSTLFGGGFEGVFNALGRLVECFFVFRREFGEHHGRGLLRETFRTWSGVGKHERLLLLVKRVLQQGLDGLIPFHILLIFSLENQCLVIMNSFLEGNRAIVALD